MQQVTLYLQNTVQPLLPCGASFSGDQAKPTSLTRSEFFSHVKKTTHSLLHVVMAEQSVSDVDFRSFLVN